MKTCRYCLNPAVLLKAGDSGYPYPENDFGPMWTCVGCQAWIGCYPGTENSIGSLADAELRQARRNAQAAFAPLWLRKAKREQLSNSQARKAGRRWLSVQMGLPFTKTHIGNMNLDECRQVVELCTPKTMKEQKNGH